MRAEPPSQALAMMKLPLSCSCRKRCARESRSWLFMRPSLRRAQVWGQTPFASKWGLTPLIQAFLEAQHRHGQHEHQEHRELRQLRPDFGQYRATQHHATDDHVEMGERQDLG